MDQTDRGRTGVNILVLNYEYPPLGGGAAPVCRDLAIGMVKAGHRVTVVTMGFPGLPAYELHEGVEIIRLNCLRRKAHSCQPWEQASYILAAKRFLKRHLQTHSYEVCHAHFIIPTGPIAKWVKKHYGIPFVITAHGSDVEGYNDKPSFIVMHRLLRPAWRKIVEEAYAVAAPSEFLLNLMKQEMRSRKYTRIPNGLDLEKYHAINTRKEKRILLMGRMQKSKNIQLALKAVSLIPNEIWGDWHVDILGDGPYRETLEQLCTKLDMNSRVTFHGWVENGSAKQLDFLRRSAVYISASRFENCPMAVLEATACGSSLLLSDIQGHRQFFPGKNMDPVFFQPDDTDVLAEKIEERIRKEPDQEEAETDLRDYDYRQITKRYLNLLQRAVSEDSPFADKI